MLKSYMVAQCSGKPVVACTYAFPNLTAVDFVSNSTKRQEALTLYTPRCECAHRMDHPATPSYHALRAPPNLALGLAPDLRVGLGGNASM